MGHMKFFTRDWHQGELSDSEADAAVPAYEAHLRTIAPSLPDALLRLTSGTSLHDGLIEQVIVDAEEGELSLALRIGDLQVGYSTLTLAYAGVFKPARQVSTFRQLLRAGAELLSDEVDISPAGFVHRLYFSTTEEVSLVFETLRLTQVQRSDRSISIPLEERLHLVESGAA